MITFKNNLNYNLYRQNLLGGNVAGIWKDNSFFLGLNSYPIMNYHYVTAQFNNFEKNFLSEDFKVNYHLSGYGIHYNEALASFLGESSERYAFTLLYQNLKRKIIYASHAQISEQLKNSNSLILPLNLINIYFEEKDSKHYICEDDVIQWIPLKSLYHPDRDVLIPLQMLVLFDKTIFKDEKQFTNSGVSTGTASHETFEKSLTNSIIEILQIDSYNLWWYGGIEGKAISVNIAEKLNEWFKRESIVHKFLDNFDVSFTDISFDKPIHVVVCEVKSKAKDLSLPKYVVGVQGDTNLEQCIYRSLLECVTVLEYTMTEVWSNTTHFKNISENIKNHPIDNLDDNVMYYAKYGLNFNMHKRKITFQNIKNAKNLHEIINELKHLSYYACYLDITPVEFYNKNLVVVRTFIPELLTIALPSYPPYLHPRYKEIGGIINDIPHPLA
ncbi:TPA: YcaO-like family protein [Staphylococcus aureus]|uniref:YcaO-like family protein n=1 Tax=Staphylococcus aureus TaxID=1280 RepID=UPI00085BCF5B|nr:YcaO-like family protein [Staphylococcus aureus]MEB8331141.1 YcaO-like family protein [Staphylococcus aureus]UVJ24984.1 YcaO-like family protein [Staphylococcus aureus]UVJ34122.1 YcaO-like family protein [Staphylococcus aureus]SCR32279.1 streptolysin-associated protein SagD-like protein [Staphylococcus aureus]SCR40485.1 streptolysin-associated protein SagD-like protein [Staphylococcus aureus]